MVCGNVQRKIYATGLTIYSLWIHVHILTILQLTWKDEGKKVHPPQALYFAWLHVQYRLYSTEHERLDEKGCIHKLFISHVSNCKRLTSRPYLCGQIASQNRPVMGTCSILIIQNPCPEIGFIYFIFPGPRLGLMVWREQVNYLYKGNAFWFLCSSDWVNIMASILPLALFLIDTFQLLSFQPPPFQPTFKMLFLPHVCDNFKHLGGYRSTSNPV